MAKKLKDWFDGDCATLLGRAIKANHKTFDIDSYAAEVDRGVRPLELKDRVGLMSDALGTDELHISLDLCEAITQRHTAEYAIRPYLELYPSETLTRIHQWVRHPNSHVRRLALEGVRPRLPWARRLTAFSENPHPAAAIAHALRSDPSRYVRKSVANLINDISKDHAALVIELVGRWQDDVSQDTRWIIRHGTRTLRKRGLMG
ncbi:DNA alkylation repair protein [Roseobacter litoralis]|uniref:DNA alkylation repair protein n=1 Tax=Roseobacter litoralis TaxID=42443 RepID=UPI0024943EA8|nr:DNA alkylation repair protein [Roseobacter litoralis]